jgi:hypothetical protein
VVWPEVSASLRDTQLTCTKDGFERFSEHRKLQTGSNETLPHVVLRLQPPFDPQALTEAQLRRVRADFGAYVKGFERQCDDPSFGIRCVGDNGRTPRGVQRGLVFSIDAYPPEKRKLFYDEYTDGLLPDGRKRDYTHLPVGPFASCVNARGYHGVYRQGPCTADAINAYLRELYGHRVDGVPRPIIPICFAFGDNSTEFKWPDGVDRSLCRMVVPNWEHEAADCALQKTRALFPNALLYWHNPVDRSSPKGDACAGPMDAPSWYQHARRDYNLAGVLIQTNPWKRDVATQAERFLQPMIQAMGGVDAVLFETDIYVRYWDGFPEAESLAYNDALLRHEAIRGAVRGFGSGSTIAR